MMQDKQNARIYGTSRRRSSLANISSSGLGGSSDGVHKSISWQQGLQKLMKNISIYYEARETKA
jgi:hypothetical protein